MLKGVILSGDKMKHLQSMVPGIRTVDFAKRMPPMMRSMSTKSTPSERQERKVHRIGVGGTKLGKANPQQYAKVVETGLQNGVLTFESVNGGEESLAQAFTLAMMQIGYSESCPKEKDVTLTARFGYRTEAADGKSFKNDVPLENDIGASTTDASGKVQSVDKAFHNISSDYVFDCIEKNPLVKLKRGEWGQSEFFTKAFFKCI